LTFGIAGLAGGLAIGLVGVAGAADNAPPGGRGSAAAFAQEQPSSGATVSPSPAPSAPPAPLPERRLGGPGFKGRGWGGPQHLGRGVLHGEFVTPKAGGGFQTHQVQQGTATAVTGTSITVRSEDGFTRSYAVTADTMVNAGREGITSISVDVLVHVRAVGGGNNATAVQVTDVSKVMAQREKFAPQRRKPAPNATQSPR
jgi:hypothetical protein